MKKITEKQIQIAFATSDMYQLLAISLQLPTSELAKGLLDGSMSMDIQAILEEIGVTDDTAEELIANFKKIQEQQKSVDESLSELRQEYTRLFAYPKNPAIPIYETLFLYNPNQEEGNPLLFVSTVAMDADRCYKKAGLTLSKEVNEPADHMATEMEFMMFLYRQKAIALQADNLKEIKRREGEIKEFHKNHLQKWAKDFFERCIEVSQNDAYKAFGELGSFFIGAITID